jgi:hypothetical protein
MRRMKEEKASNFMIFIDDPMDFPRGQPLF